MDARRRDGECFCGRTIILDRFRGFLYLGKVVLSAQARRMRFLLVTTPVTGHVSPVLPVARKLVERGHEILWYTSARFQAKIETTGARFVGFQTAQDIDYHRIDELFPERAKLKGIALGKWELKNLIDVSLEQYYDIPGILRGFQADIILADSFALSALLTAETTGLPLALLNVSNLFARSRDTAPDGLGLAPNSTRLGQLRNGFLNWIVFQLLFRDVNRHFNERRVRLGLPPVTDTFLELAIRRSRVFLQPTAPSFEYPRSDLPGNVHFIGALLPGSAPEFVPPPWWGELDTKRPVVLVSQGTVATNPDELLGPAIRGLGGEDMLVVGTTGGRPVKDIGLDPLPANVRLEPFIPFDRIVPLADVMVTNGGYGGTHFALAHGVPLVSGGESEDKAEICARIAWAGVGVNLKTKSPTPAQIRKGVRKVLEDRSFGQKAREMQRELARYDAPTKAAELLETIGKGG